MNPGIERFPYFALTFIEKEQTKKDRIIDTLNYKFNFEFFYEVDDPPKIAGRYTKNKNWENDK